MVTWPTECSACGEPMVQKVGNIHCFVCMSIKPRLYDKVRLMQINAVMKLIAQDRSRGCQICHIPFPDLVTFDIDHDDSTKTYRGLLCRRCNIQLSTYERGVGSPFAGNVQLHIATIDYLNAARGASL